MEGRSIRSVQALIDEVEKRNRDVPQLYGGKPRFCLNQPRLFRDRFFSEISTDFVKIDSTRSATGRTPGTHPKILIDNVAEVTDGGEEQQ